eukprot:1679434-Rhodomonas_salina.1
MGKPHTRVGFSKAKKKEQKWRVESDAGVEGRGHRLQWFCEKEIEEVARVLAAEEDCEGLRAVWAQYESELRPHWLQILSSLPESCRPGKYQSVLPKDEGCGAEGVVVAGGAA